MVVRVLCNQIVSPDFVGGQHELTSVNDIPRCVCGVGGGGAEWNHTWRIRPIFPDARGLYALHSIPKTGFTTVGNVGLEGPTWTGVRAVWYPWWRQ